MSAITRNQEAMERKAKHCVHFNGVQHDVCDAGVNYKDIPQRANRQFVCFGEMPGCEKYQAQGMEAVEKRFAEADKSYERIVIARKAITAHSNGKRGVQGRIDCPVCLKPNALQYSIASCNGHIHACCTTVGCVGWME